MLSNSRTNGSEGNLDKESVKNIEKEGLFRVKIYHKEFLDWLMVYLADIG